MKKFYASILALIAIVCCGFQASAYSVNISWNEAGAVKLYKGSCDPENEIDVTGLTEYVFEYTTTTYLYVLPTEGNVFEKIMEPGVTNPKIKFSTNQSYGGQFYNKFLGTSHDGKDLVITTKKLERNSSMTINVVNGADYIGGYVEGLFAPLQLKDGANTLKFNPEYETGIYLTVADGKAVDQFYKVELNGTAIAKNNLFMRYNVNGIKAGDNLTIQVFEGEAPVEEKVTVTLEYAAGLEGCLNNVRNWSTSQFIQPTDNKLEIVKGQDLQFNFVTGDYTITDILANGVSCINADGYTWKTSDSSASLRFKVNEDVTLKVDGAATIYQQIAMTAYVMNPQGVKIKAGSYSGDNYIDMTGKAIAKDIVLPQQVHTDSEGNVTYITPSFTLTPENAQEINFNIDDRKGYNVYVEPAAGWYISTVQDSKKEETGYLDKDYDKTLYVVALPLDNNNSATINVSLSDALFSNLVFKSNDVLAMSWDNPASSYKLSNNTANEIKYTEGYQTPFTIASRMVVTGINCMVDNRVLALGDAETAVSYSLDLVDGSQVWVSSENYAAKASTLKIKGSGSKTATYTYGTLKRTGASDYNLLNGTTVSVKPSDADCMMSVNGTTVYSPKNGINMLTDGEYTFEINEPTTVSVADDVMFVEITKTLPLQGQLVSEFDSYTVYLPALDGENMFYVDFNALSTVKVVSASGASVEASDIQPEQELDGSFKYIIYFETIDEPGEYTVNIPAGFFFEAAWSDEAGDFAPVANGASTKAFAGKFTIDPAAPSFHLDPVQNSEVNDLSSVYIIFPGASMAEFVEDSEITLTGAGYSATAGEVTTVTGRDHPTCKISFAVPPVKAGEYTLNLPAGAFVVDGWKESEAYGAVYNYTPMYELTPAPGSTIEETTFTISFPSATKAELIGSRFDFTLSQGETYATPGMNVEAVAGASVPTFTISLDPEAQRPPVGKLTLSINDGAFSVDGKESPYISATYDYEAEIESAYQTDPAGNFLVIPTDEWGMVMWTFIFDEAATVENAWDVDSDATVTVNGTKVATMSMPESNMLMMALESKEGLKDGDVLRVQIPAGAFKLSGVESPAIDRTWTLAEMKDYTWTTDPADGSTIGKLEEFTITFVEAESGKQPAEGVANESHSYADVKQGWAVFTQADITHVSGGEFKVTLRKPAVEAGTYTVNFIYGTFQFDGCQNYETPITLTFTIDPTLGLTNIAVEGNEGVSVVSINGRVMMKNAPASQLKSLAPGVYIVNGRKVFVK